MLLGRRVCVGAVLGLALVLVSVAAAPTPTSEILTDKPCLGGGDINTMASVPRRGKAFTDVSGNWGDYPGWFDCTGPADDRECSSLDPDMNDILDGSDDRAEYFEGVVMYTAVGILMAFLSVFFLTCFIIFRYCCCCCCRKSQRCKCGGKYPLPRSGSCCSMGYQLLRAGTGSKPAVVPAPAPAPAPTAMTVAPAPAPVGGTTHPDDIVPGTENDPQKTMVVGADGTLVPSQQPQQPQQQQQAALPPPATATAAPNSAGEFGYAKCGRIGSLLYLLVFLLSVTGFILAGEFNGNRATIDAAKAVSRAPTSAMNLVRDSVDPLGTFLQNLASSPLRGLLEDITAIVTNATDIPQLQSNLSCILLEIDRFPEVDTLVTLVDDVNADIATMDGTLVTLQGNLRHVDAVLGTMSTQADTVDTLVSDFDGQLSALTAATNQLNTTLDGIQTIQQDFAADPSGRAFIMEAYTIQIQEGFPTSDDIASVTTLIDDALAGDMSGGGTLDSPEEVARNWYVGNATALRRQFQVDLPDFSVVADTADAFNTAADSTLTSALQSVFDDLDSAETALNSIVSTAVMNSTFRGVLNSTSSLQLDVLNNTLLALGVQIETLIDFANIRHTLERVKLVQNAIPCMQAAGDLLLTLNDTVVSLPDDVTKIVDLSADLNETLHPTLVEIDSILGSLNSTEADLKDIDVGNYTVEVTKSQEKVDVAVADIDISSLDADLAAIDANRDVDFAAIRADVEAFNATLAFARVPTALIATLREFESTRLDIISLLGTTSGDMFVLDGGYCSTSNGTYCKDEEPDHMCSGVGNFCTARGVVRCRFDQTVACSVGDSSPCGIGADRCMLEDTTLEELKAKLTLADGNRTILMPALSATQLQMRTVINDSTFDLGDLKTDLNGAIDASEGVDTSGLAAASGSMRSAINAVNIATYNDAVADARTQIDAVDFADVRTQLEDFNSTVVDFKTDQRGFVVDGVNGTAALAGILFDRMDGYLADLDFTSLATIRSQEGLSGMVRQIVAIADDSTNFISDTTDLFSERMTLVRDLEDDDIFRILDILSLSRYADAGSMYFFGSLFNEDKMVDLDDPTLDTVFKDINDNEYANDTMCLTAACIDASLEQAQNEPLSDYSDIPVPFTAQNFISLLWVFPGLVVLLGLWSLCCFGCCCKKRDNGGSWQKVPVSWMTGVICCQMPVLFVIMGLLFPIMMFYADTCTGVANVGLQWVDGMGDTLCVSSDYVGGEGTLQACTYDTKVRDDRRLNFTIDLREMYIGLMSECSSTDPYLPIWQGIERTAAPIPLDVVDEFLEDMDKDGANSSFVIRDPIRAALRTAASRTGDSIVTLARDMSGAIDCQGIHDSFHNMKEAMCCDVLTALYWIVAAWYLIVWSYCLCGCCSGLLARKRLAARPWGKIYEENVFLTPNAALVNEQYAPTSPLGMVDPNDMKRFGGVNNGGGGVVSGQDMAGMVDGPSDPGYGGGSGIPVADAGPMFPNTYVDDLDKPTGRYADV